MTETNSERAIGRLEGKLDALIKTVEQQGQQSTEGRAKIYERLEKVDRDTQLLTGRMEAVEGTVTRMGPVFMRVGSLLERSKGALWVLAIFWLFMGGLILEGIRWVGHVAAKAFMGGP